jgi:hypothetical protein
MPRKVRLQYPGALYHVLSRGGRREAIFLNNVDRQDFLNQERASVPTIGTCPGSTVKGALAPTPAGSPPPL